MSPKKKKRAAAPKNKDEVGELIMQLSNIGLLLVEKGLDEAKKRAKKQNLFKKFPYLNQAMENVGGIIALLKMGLNEKRDKNERKKGNKKI